MHETRGLLNDLAMASFLDDVKEGLLLDQIKF